MAKIIFPADHRSRIEKAFPKLAGGDWRPLSLDTKDYQCIAWAACDNTRRWWPGVDYWPLDPPHDDLVDDFVRGFETLGYNRCESAEFEVGYQKVAIFATDSGRVKHMARQCLLGNGWLSKLGDWEDIWHLRLEDISGDPASWTRDYGVVRQILRRSWLRAAPVWLWQRVQRRLSLLP